MEFKQFLLGLLICFLLSFLLGVERQYRRRLLGLRTMILVSIGAYLFVSFSFLLNGYQTDATRIAAQVVAGIGFLGAGVIIKDNKNTKVKGLTTAATLWCDASIGVLCAGGFLKEAIVAAIVVLFSNIVLRYFNYLINNRVEEKNIIDVFSITFNLNSDNMDDIEKLKETITSLINKTEYFETDNYQINKNKFKIDIIVHKSNIMKLDKFVSRMVADFKISNYEFKKIAEYKNEDTEEL